MFLIVNLDTKKIESYSIHWPMDETSMIKTKLSLAELQPPLKGFLITEPRLVAIVLEARTYLANMEPVLDQNNNLVDIKVVYPDLGADR